MRTNIFLSFYLTVNISVYAQIYLLYIHKKHNLRKIHYHYLREHMLCIRTYYYNIHKQL